MDIEYMCRHLAKLVRVQICVYDKEWELKQMYAGDGEQQNPLEYDQSLKEEFLAMEQTLYPILCFQDPHCVYAIINNQEDSSYIVGPVCIKKGLRGVSKEVIRRYDMDPSMPFHISYMDINRFLEGVLLLHYSITDVQLTPYDIYQQHFIDESMMNAVEKKVSDVIFDYHEQDWIHNPYQQEVREQESIEKGDMEGFNTAIREVYAGQLGVLADDDFRSAKNLGIVVLAISCRAAIRGGMIPEVAYSMSDAYIRKVEEIHDHAQLFVFLRSAQRKYIQIVAELKSKEQRNPIIEECKDYVFRNIHNKILLTEMARELHVNPNYLSELFHKYEGIKLYDYISREKIRIAEHLLMYSNYSFEKIAYYLGYSSQSHFGKVFKKVKDMTPKRYRDIFGVKEFIDDFHEKTR